MKPVACARYLLAAWLAERGHSCRVIGQRLGGVTRERGRQLARKGERLREKLAR